MTVRLFSLLFPPFPALRALILPSFRPPFHHVLVARSLQGRISTRRSRSNEHSFSSTSSTASGERW